MSSISRKLAAAALCAAALVVALGAAPAQASRAYDSNIPGFNGATSVAFDASDGVWVADHGRSIEGVAGQNGIYKYGSYPSHSMVANPNTYVPWSFYILTLQAAVDQETDEVFVAQANGREVDVFAPDGPGNPCEPGEAYCFSHAWTAINGVFGFEGIHVAIDNTNTFSAGRVYLSLAAPENTVEAYDPDQRRVDFPATASYIQGNKLTGTPSGGFGQVQHLTVDGDGNIYVTDVVKKVVDEFDSTGIFLRTFPAPKAHGDNPIFGAAAVDPVNGNLLIPEGGYDAETEEGGLREFDASGNPLGTITKDSSGQSFYPTGLPGVNSAGYLYVPTEGRVDIFDPAPPVPKIAYEPVSSPTATAGTLNASVDPNDGGDITECKFEYGTDDSYGTSVVCSPDPSASPPGSNFSSPTDVSTPLAGLTTDATYHYRVVVHNANGVRYGADRTYTPHKVLGLTTDPATEETEDSATLNGSFVGNGEDTHYYFEWGSTDTYGNTSPAPPGTDAGSPSGPGRTPVFIELTGLSLFKTYHYRVVAVSGGEASYGEDRRFTTTPGVPSIGKETTSEVHADRAVLHAKVNPNGAMTTYHFEYVDDAEYQQSGWASAVSAPSQETRVGMGKTLQTVAPLLITGLKGGTIYHYRAVANNAVGTGVPSVDRTFKTFPAPPSISDPCANAHVRQQTGTALLLDCRAYELVSAANADGYDVESNLVPGQSPFGGYPEAEGPSRVLYGIHDGALSTGNPTNRGVDPYVATRGQDGWTTEYVGIPSNDPNASGPFASTLLEADPGLHSFVFGGNDICSPCFADGSSGLPVHRSDGSLVQGMAGSMSPGPSAEPDGYVSRHLSADGSHFVFASTSKFEPDGNSNGDVSVYDRDLSTGVTHVVSKTPAGATMTGPGIGELDISSDGNRIVFGQQVSGSGDSRYWHLYMNVGDSTQSIDLTPGTTSGVLYDGMTADGSKVYFTTKDQLTGDDTDNSADLYRAETSGSGATLTRISTGTGGTGNTDSCEPSANTINEHWNTTASEEDCGIVAVGGGGGVASGDGTVYFLSPELLDGPGGGVQNAPNLYIARPGAGPRFVATLESSSNSPLPPAAHPFLRQFGAFENPAGVAVDHSNGDVYVLDIGREIGAGYVYKYDSSGHAVLGFGVNGKLTVAGMAGFYGMPAGIAVDNDPSSSSYRDLYVPEPLEGSVKKFDSTGAHVGDISNGGFATSVSVDPSNGHVYIANGFFGSEVAVFDAEGNPITSFSVEAHSSGPTNLAVDSGGNVYVVNGGGYFHAKGTAEVYDSSGNYLKQLDSNPSYAVAVDPADGHILVDEGSQVSEFDSAGDPFGTPIGTELLSASIGVAIDSGNVFVTNPAKSNVASFAPAVVPTDPETDNPLVVDSVSAPGARRTGDFQVTPSGRHAAFSSTLALTGYENAAHREVYRYDADTAALDCPSCSPTGQEATGDANLPADGLGLTDDGRVFFDSLEGLVDRDLNNKVDAYEWEPAGAGACQEEGGCTELISGGASPFAARLLGVSADGVDAYFFTRDKLAEEDQNGNSVKVYDARTLGGFAYVPASIPCKASDECHGPGTATPPPPDIKSIAGTPERRTSSGCKKGFVRKAGKCVKRHKRKARRHHRKRSAHKSHGGAR